MKFKLSMPQNAEVHPAYLPLLEKSYELTEQIKKQCPLTARYLGKTISLEL